MSNKTRTKKIISDLKDLYCPDQRSDISSCIPYILRICRIHNVKNIKMLNDSVILFVNNKMNKNNQILDISKSVSSHRLCVLECTIPAYNGFSYVTMYWNQSRYYYRTWYFTEGLFIRKFSTYDSKIASSYQQYYSIEQAFLECTRYEQYRG